MVFQIGNRVVSLIDDSGGLRKGEEGTIVELRDDAMPTIYWDNYNSARHTANGLVPDGHGWFIFSENVIAVIEPDDYGELGAASENINTLLFDM